jgi:trk system potassium uptake protein TrkA
LPEATIIFGDGASGEVLFEEGLMSMDAFVSLTNMDEENILLSSFASSQNVPTVISKVNRTELANMAEKFDMSEDKVESIVRNLNQKGLIYIPSTGYLKRA